MAWARAAHRYLTLLLLLGIAVQFFLAGAGAFDAQSWDSHSMLGFLFTVATLLLLILAALARALVGLTAALFAVAVLQLFLGRLGAEEEAWLGALHGLNALVVTGLTIMLATRSGRRRREREAAAAQ